QPTSSSPAARSAAQALMRFPAFRNEVWTLAASLVENVRVSSMRCSHDRGVTGASTIVLERLAAVAKLKCVRATLQDSLFEVRMVSRLMAGAVPNGGAKYESAIWERIYAFWLGRLVYTQIWEDPEADLAALQLQLGSTIVTISSGGCNALSYLTARPAQVYAVDLNEAHLSLLKFKLARTRAFPIYSYFWQFFGEAASSRNLQLYRNRLRPLLDAQARAYWDKRNVIGRPRYAHFGNGFYRHGIIGRII